MDSVAPGKQSLAENRPNSKVLSLPVLNELCADLERRRGKLDPLTLAWRLAELRRGIGDLARAAREYDVCASGGMARAARLLAAMRGEAAPPPDSTEALDPAPFVWLHDFLPLSRLQEVRAAVSARRERLQLARIGIAEGKLDTSVRSACLVGGGRRLREIVIPEVVAAMKAHDVCRRLRLESLPSGKAELVVIAYLTGGQYIPHRDCKPGLGGRRVTFLWFLHDEPKTFSGGDLLLYDEPAGSQRWFTRIVPRGNSALFFPSERLHEVTPVVSSSADPFGGRLVLTVWLHGSVEAVAGV